MVILSAWKIKGRNGKYFGSPARLDHIEVGPVGADIADPKISCFEAVAPVSMGRWSDDRCQQPFAWREGLVMVCDSEEEWEGSEKVGWHFCNTKWVNNMHPIPYKNPSGWCFVFRRIQSMVFIPCVVGMSPPGTVLKVVPSLAPQLMGIHPCPLYSSR